MTHEPTDDIAYARLRNIVARVQTAINEFNLEAGEAIERSERPDLWDPIIEVRIDDATAMLRAIEGGWMPIETAPSDGRQILVGFLGQFAWVYFIAAARGGQTNAAGYALPTHWRPLPPAPKEG